MNVVDSSAWLEYFADGPNARHFARPIEHISDLLVPSISVLEVFRCILRQRNEDSALQAAAAMQRGTIIDLNVAIATTAAKLGVDLKLPLADSVMLATARLYSATLWTQDSDFAGIEGVKFFAKP